MGFWQISKIPSCSCMQYKLMDTIVFVEKIKFFLHPVMKVKWLELLFFLGSVGIFNFLPGFKKLNIWLRFLSFITRASSFGAFYGILFFKRKHGSVYICMAYLLELCIHRVTNFLVSLILQQKYEEINWYILSLLLK